jgi:hypothetical protein
MTAMTRGLERIAAERIRQLTKHGWDSKHDDEHTDGSLVMAAVCYAAAAADERVYVRKVYATAETFTDPWPGSWLPHYDARPHNGNVLANVETDAQRLRLLEKAGALIAADIDRLLRKVSR